MSDNGRVRLRPRGKGEAGSGLEASLSGQLSAAALRDVRSRPVALRANGSGLSRQEAAPPASVARVVMQPRGGRRRQPGDSRAREDGNADGPNRTTSARGDDDISMSRPARHEEGLLCERGRRCDYSYSCSRSPSRGSRDISPVSVGSSVLEGDPQDAGSIIGGSRGAGKRRAVEDQLDAPSSAGSPREPLRPAPAPAATVEPKRRRVRRVRRKLRPQADSQQYLLPPPAAAEEIEDSEASGSEPAEDLSARPLKSSRRSAPEAALQHPAAGPSAPASSTAATPVRRTAAKSAPGCPPATLAATSQALANPLEAELTEPEQQQLKVDILQQLRRHVQVKQDEAEVLAEFIFVLVDQKKSRTEMISELSLMNKEAVPFVDWLEKQKAQLLAARPPPAPARLASPPPPPPPVSRAETLSASAEDRGSSQRRSDRRGHYADDDALVVITERLVLQPNREHGAAAAPPVRELTPEQKKMEEANQKKLDLIGEMTKKLQVILQRLSDKTLDDATKERYQSLAQTIQTQMSALSPKNPVASAAAEKAAAAGVVAVAEESS